MTAPAQAADGPARRPHPGRGARARARGRAAAVAGDRDLRGDRRRARAGGGGRLPGHPARGVRARRRGRRADRRPGAAPARDASCWRRSRPRRAASASANCASTSAAGVPAYNPASPASHLGHDRWPIEPGSDRTSSVRPPPRPGVRRSREARMAVRLHMKLGVVAEHDRLPDSPDTLVVVEPSVGSVARSKGHLYLLVTSRICVAPRPRGDPPGRRDDPQRVLLRRVGRDPGLPPEGDRDRQQAARPPGRPARPQVARRQRPDRGRRRGRPRQRDVRRDGRAGRGLPHPPGAPLDAARPAPRTRPARRASSSPTSGAARSRSATRSSWSRPNVIAQLGAGRAQGRDADAPPAVRDGAPPPPVRGRRRLRQRRRDRLRGDRGRRDEPRPDARPGPARPSRSPARPTARRSRSPTTSRRPGSRSRAAAGNAQDRGRRRVRARSSPGSRTSCPGASRPTGG